MSDAKMCIRDSRGVFIINLKCVGAGQLSMITTEGEHRTLKADRRITGLFSRVASDFHRPLASVEMPYVDTDAHAAMERSLRAMTLAGVEGSSFACAYTEQDHPINLNADNVNYAADLVTEVDVYKRQVQNRHGRWIPIGLAQQ